MGKFDNSRGSSQIMRDPEEIHHKLWARKKLIKRRERNDQNKVRKRFFKMKEDEVNTEKKDGADTNADEAGKEMTFEEKRRMHLEEDIKN